MEPMLTDECLEPSEEEEDEEYAINWDETLYLPEPHLITEQSFNEYFPYQKYFDKVSRKESVQNPSVIEPSKKKTKQEKQKKTSPMEKSEIFEDDRSSSDAADAIIFESHTKYHLKLAQPKVSSITNTERRFYRWFRKNLNNGSKKVIEQNEQKFHNLMMKITKEQSEYQQFLHSCAVSHSNEYTHLNPHVKNFILGEVSKATITLLHSTKKFFSLKQTINLTHLPPVKVPPKFNCFGCISEQLEIPSLKVPPCNVPLQSPQMPNETSQQYNRSIEPIVELCKKEGANVYVQHSALLSILESLITPSCEWLIPLSIERTATNNKSIVIISKPYPKRKISERDANSMYYKHFIHDFLKTNQADAPVTTKTSGEVSNKTNKDSCVNLFFCGQQKLLVESHIDCVDAETKETYQINPKTEFQPFIGCEQFSLSDLCRLWWDSRLANTNYILCTRMDPRNNCIRRIDRYTREMLCAQGCPYNPEMFFQHLHYLVDVLLDVSPGKYMMEHATGNNHFFLFEEKEKGFTTLETKYKDLLSGKRELISDDANSLPWLPIDMKIMPGHMSPDLEVPWLFDLPSYNMEVFPLGNKINKKQALKKLKNAKRKERFLKLKESTEHFNPTGFEPLPPGIEPPPPGEEPPPPGTEMDLKSPVFKTPVLYDADDFDDLMTKF